MACYYYFPLLKNCQKFIELNLEVRNTTYYAIMFAQKRRPSSHPSPRLCGIKALYEKRNIDPFIEQQAAGFPIHSCTAIDVSSGNACIVQESPEHSLVHPHCSHGSTCIQKPVRWVSRPFTQKNSTHSGRMYMYLNIFLFQRLTLGRNLRKILSFCEFEILSHILHIWF